MKRISFLTLFITLTFLVFAQKPSDSYLKYIEKYHDIAIEQMTEHHIPASITLAQGLLESGAGSSVLAQQANNHFGIKCGRSWYGRTILRDDDQKNECFRVYPRVKDSYEDHSDFLLQQRYSFLFDYKITDYKSWAKGLRTAGYATDPKYPSKLISLIETYKLYQYDDNSYRESRADVQRENYNKTHKGEEHYGNSSQLFDYIVIVNNGRKCIRLISDDSLEHIAKAKKISLKHLLKYNDYYEITPLYRGDYVYLQPKKRQAEEKYKTYEVKPGDSMHSIAQTYGIKLKALYTINNLEYGTPVKEHQRLRLRKAKH